MLILPSGYQLQHHEQLDSTNEEMRRKIMAVGIQEKTVILADKQHTGRGRGGREWVSEPGNLYISVLHKLSANGEGLNGYTLAAGLAVRDTFAHYLPNKNIQWKWPNDVLLEGKKASGILLERVENKSGTWLITGVGINLVSAPDAGVLWATASIAEHSAESVERDKILKTFVKYLDSYYKRVVAGELESLIKDCLSHAARLGEVITVRLPDATIKGVFNGIDKDGNLLLATDEGERPISAGDVFL